MDTKAFVDSLTAGVNEPPTYGESINQTSGNAKHMGALQALSGLESRGTEARSNMSSMQTVAQQETANEDAARRHAEKQKAAELKAEQDMLDPKNFIREVNEQGGYNFFDPAGNPISLVEYARATNKRVTDVIKGSESIDDIDFMNDYKMVQQMGRIMQSGNKEERDKFFEKNPDWADMYRDKPFEQIVQDFHETYPEYFRRAEQQQSQNPLLGDGGESQQVIPHSQNPMLEGRTADMMGAPEGTPTEDPRNIAQRAIHALVPGGRSWNQWWKEEN